MSRLIILISVKSNLLEESYQKLSSKDFDVHLGRNLTVTEKNAKISNRIYIDHLEKMDAADGFEDSDISTYHSLLGAEKIYGYSISFGEPVFLTAVLKEIIEGNDILVDNDDAEAILKGTDYQKNPSALITKQNTHTMQTVNENMVRDLLTPLAGSADLDEKIEEYRNVDSDNPITVKEIIAATIKPWYENRSEEYKAIAKRSLSYFLTTNRINYGYIYDSCLIAFDHPTDARDFFVWIWEMLFPEETYRLKDVKHYVEIDDINEGTKY